MFKPIPRAIFPDKPAEVTGQSFGQLHYIMNDQPVSVGDMVLTSGLDQIYPKGLPVGTVTRAGPGNIYKDILVTPAAALDRLETVLVLPKTAAQEPVPMKNGSSSRKV